MDARTKAFQALKPVCVALDGAAKSLAGGKASAARVITELEGLKRALVTHTGKSNGLHPKLAEYVFYPISQVLRFSQQVPIQGLEICLQCVSVLVEKGWQSDLPPQTAAQLIILCTLLADRKPQGTSFTETTDELRCSALWCLYHIFTAAGNNGETKDFLTTEAHFPQLGQTISVSLDAIGDSHRVLSQAAAAAALEALLSNVADRELHASFLPGIMSKLAKTMTQSSNGRTNARILEKCLGITTLLLSSTMGQRRVHQSPTRPGAQGTNGSAANSIIDADWVSGAATRLRPVLASIMRLRSHDNAHVRTKLGRLCLIVLRECRTSLADCNSLSLECLILICAGDRESSLSIELEMLLQADQSVSSSLQTLLYEWLQALPTVMQSADDGVKSERLRLLRTSYELLAQTNADLTAIDQLAVTALRDSVIVTISAPAGRQHAVSGTNVMQVTDLSVLQGDRTRIEYETPLVMYKGQEQTLRAIQDVAIALVDHSSSSELQRGLARALRQVQGDAALANFWLLLVASERSLTITSRAVEDTFLNLPSGSHMHSRNEMDELYNFALSTLSSENEDGGQDHRLQALALQALGLSAQSAGEDFRYELVDALYPVLHSLATPDDMLQRTSITTLNILASACSYASVKDLIVENVDYLVNAVALKLNAFDVSPQAPQVLLMMLRLAGPTLLPYLEDTVESIFAALEDFHGYPLLVEMLFKVLSVMAEEGVRTPQLAITADGDATGGDGGSEKWSSTTVPGLQMQLRLRAQDELDAMKESPRESEPHPQRPWGSTENSGNDNDEDDAETGARGEPADNKESQPPAPKIYSLLLKISELTQHFLPSASASLRTTLLGLIRTTVPALAMHENSFLPLLNTLWPEIVARLDDEEPHVVATALDIVRILCENAKDFMRTRIVKLWPRLVEIHQSIAKGISEQQPGRRRSDASQLVIDTTSTVSNGRLDQTLLAKRKGTLIPDNASTRYVSSALQSLVRAMVEHVNLPPEHLDEAFEIVTTSIDTRQVSAASADDTLWLALVRCRSMELPVSPAIPHGRWRFAKLPS